VLELKASRKLLQFIESIRATLRVGIDGGHESLLRREFAGTEYGGTLVLRPWTRKLAKTVGGDSDRWLREELSRGRVRPSDGDLFMMTLRPTRPMNGDSLGPIISSWMVGIADGGGGPVPQRH